MKPNIILFILLVSLCFPQYQFDELFAQSELNFITPESYGAAGDGVTNDANAIYRAIYENPGKTILFSKHYRINSSINIDLSGNNLDIMFTDNAKISSNYVITSFPAQYYKLQGILRFSNGNSVIVRGLNLESYNTGLSYFSGLIIENANQVILDCVSSKYAGYVGISLHTIGNLLVQNCIADSNLYAGLMVVNSKHTTITGGSYSYNGSAPFLNGYGLTISHQFGTGRSNQDITIIGVQANYNFRKGIDFHGGIGANILANHVKGFTYAGIYAVGEGGYEVNHKADVRDVIVDGNIVEGDSAWVSSLDFSGYAKSGNPPYGYSDINGRAIQVGIYKDGASPSPLEGLGSFKVTNNIIKNFTWYDNNTSIYRSDYAISCLAGKVKTVEIYNNTITNCTINQNIIGVNSGNEYGQPTVTKISGNVINESRVINENGILVTAGEYVIVKDNLLRGVTTTASSSAFIKVFEYNAGADISGGDVSGNLLGGTSFYGIYIIGDVATTPKPIFNISNNTFLGTCNRQKIYTGSASIGVRMNGNMARVNPESGLLVGAQSYNLPDKSAFNSGTAEYSLQVSSDSLKTINTISIASDNPGGSAMFEISISATTGFYNHLVYNFVASTYNDSADKTSHWETRFVSEIQYGKFGQVAAEYRPIVKWDGETDNKTLQIVCTRPNTTYHVVIKFTTFNLIPY